MDQVVNSSEKRLARVLLLLAGLGKSSKRKSAVLKVNQQTLAEMVGTTRSRISFFMNRFREMGFVHYNGGLHVSRGLHLRPPGVSEGQDVFLRDYSSATPRGKV